MSDALCTVADCDTAAPSSYLCGRHDWELERNLAALPALLTELDVTRTRTDRITVVGNRAHRGTARTDETPCWCGCTTTDSEHHVATHGHQHDPATRMTDRKHARPDLGSASPLPISDSAADAYVRAENTLVTWTRHLVHTRGATLRTGTPPPPPPPTTHGPTCAVGCYHPSCTAIRRTPTAVDTQPPLGVLALWLLGHLATIRLDEAAGELHHDVITLRRHLRHVTDRPADRVYAGPCDARTMTGPCTLDLYAPAHVLADPDSDAVITCDGWNTEHGEGCGATHARTERRTFLLDALEDHAAPVAELLPMLCQLLPAPEPPRRRVWDWRNRGDVRVVGLALDGTELVSASDLASALRRYQPMPQRNPRRAGVA